MADGKQGMKQRFPGAPTDTWSAYPPLAYAWTYANRPRKTVSAEFPPLTAFNLILVDEVSDDTMFEIAERSSFTLVVH